MAAVHRYSVVPLPLCSVENQHWFALPCVGTVHLQFDLTVRVEMPSGNLQSVYSDTASRRDITHSVSQTCSCNSIPAIPLPVPQWKRQCCNFQSRQEYVSVAPIFWFLGGQPEQPFYK